MAHCTNSSYQLVDGAILLIIPATLGVMGIAAAIAWATAGRVLAPLQSLTQTAQSISESDMTQRIPVAGTDEIAKLTLVSHPKIVLTDEPTAALDKKSGRDVVELMQNLAKEQGCTMKAGHA
jgi:ABC-type polar amino acid transport system ATPase subunit